MYDRGANVAGLGAKPNLSAGIVCTTPVSSASNSESIVSSAAAGLTAEPTGGAAGIAIPLICACAPSEHTPSIIATAIIRRRILITS